MILIVAFAVVGGLGLLFLSVVLPWLAVSEWLSLLGEEGVDMVNNLRNAIVATALSIIVLALDVRVVMLIYRCCQNDKGCGDQGRS